MSKVWNTMLELQANIEQQLNAVGEQVDEGHTFAWPNHVWSSPTFRRAHLDAVDARETKGLYMLHVTVFPHIIDPSPIFGFDIICGERKVTGCFHDFSASADKEHPMMTWFQNYANQFEWRKERELPEWARRIFSPGMIAAGNVSDEKEIDQILQIVSTTLPLYLENVGKSRGQGDPKEILEAQNYYCNNQRQNPHTPRVMQSLGFDADTVYRFINDCLFPDLV